MAWKFLGVTSEWSFLVSVGISRIIGAIPSTSITGENFYSKYVHSCYIGYRVPWPSVIFNYYALLFLLTLFFYPLYIACVHGWEQFASIGFVRTAFIERMQHLTNNASLRWSPARRWNRVFFNWSVIVLSVFSWTFGELIDWHFGFSNLIRWAWISLYAVLVPPYCFDACIASKAAFCGWTVGYMYTTESCIAHSDTRRTDLSGTQRFVGQGLIGFGPSPFVGGRQSSCSFGYPCVVYTQRC